jgi:hypothetical protein
MKFFSEIQRFIKSKLDTLCPHANFANLTVFKKCVYYAVRSNLTARIKSLFGNKRRFQLALKEFLVPHTLYYVNELVNLTSLIALLIM